MKKIITYSFLMLGLLACSKSIKVTETSKIKNVTLITHNPSIKIKKLYKDINQAKNRTPQELLNSLASENSIEWNRWNHYNKKLPISEKKKEWFKRRATVNREKHYSELIQELYFEYNNEQFCWVKSCSHTEFKNRRGYGLYTKVDLMIKVVNRWELYNRYVDEVILRDLSNFTCIKYVLFQHICTKQNPNDNSFLRKLLDKVYEGDALNLDILHNELMRMYDESKEGKTDELIYFEDEYLF